MGFDRPGVQIYNYDSGPVVSRDFSNYNLRTYSINPNLFNASGTLMTDWRTFWHHIDNGAKVGYILEPISTYHPELVCGGLTDGTKTCFPIPAKGVSGVIVYVNGVPQDSSTYTLHTKSNLFDDDSQADPDDENEWTEFNGTNYNMDYFAAVRQSSVKNVPAGNTLAQRRQWKTNSENAVVTAGETYTAMVAMFEASGTPRDSSAGFSWYQDASTANGNDSGSFTPVTGIWNVWSYTDVAPALTTLANVRVSMSDPGSQTVPWYFDAVALNPGDYDRWHLPSQAPALIEFNSAPATGQRVTVTCTGYRLARCRFDLGNSWTYGGPGHIYAGNLRAQEILEY
jgi:hypothetical protein